MDWYKAKNIIIVVLVALNLFLIYSLFSYWRETGITKQTLSNTVNILKKRGIELDCKLPAIKGDYPNLLYTNDRSEIYTIASRLLGGQLITPDQINRNISYGSKSVEIKNSITMEYRDTDPVENVNTSQRTAVEKYAGEFLKRNGLKASEFTIDSYSETNGQAIIEYIGRYRNYNIFSNKIIMIITSKGVNYLSCSYWKIDGISSDKKKTIMPIHEILLKNLNTGPTLTIEGIELGYNTNLLFSEDIKNHTEGPVWRITMKDGAERFFDAIGGNEIK